MFYYLNTLTLRSQIQFDTFCMLFLFLFCNILLFNEVIDIYRDQKGLKKQTIIFIITQNLHLLPCSVLFSRRTEVNLLNVEHCQN